MGRISGLFFDQFQALYASPTFLRQADQGPLAAVPDGRGRSSSMDAPGTGAAQAHGCRTPHAGVSARPPLQAGDREHQQRHFWGVLTPAIQVGCLAKSLPLYGAERALLHGITATSE